MIAQMAGKIFVMHNSVIERQHVETEVDDAHADFGFVEIVFDFLIETADLLQTGAAKRGVGSLQIDKRIGARTQIVVEGRHHLETVAAGAVADRILVLQLEAGRFVDEAARAADLR